MKQSNISHYLSHQDAPALFLRFPRLLFVYFWFNHLSVLRMKYAQRAIRKAISESGTPRTVVDAGCGMGDFLFTTPEFRNAECLTGIDVSPTNIELCRRLAGVMNSRKMEFICSDLASATIPAQTDMILCIGVLMYIAEDRAVLRKFHESLSPDGRLILYAAVNYRRNLHIYRQLSKKPGFDYDGIIGRPQTYTDESLEQRLKECGFTILEQRHSFGKTAATLFEISSIFEWLFKTLHPVISLFLIPLYLIFYPFYLLSMTADVHGSRQTGNGVMIIAKKS